MVKAYYLSNNTIYYTTLETKLHEYWYYKSWLFVWLLTSGTTGSDWLVLDNLFTKEGFKLCNIMLRSKENEHS